MTERQLNRAVNPMASTFGGSSPPAPTLGVWPNLAEATDLSSVQCRFKSYHTYRRGSSGVEHQAEALGVEGAIPSLSIFEV